MSMYKYMRKLWNQPRQSMPELWKERLILWRKQPVTVRLKRPTRIDRARSLGYKAKEGIFVVRQRLGRGGRQRPGFGKRRSKRMSPRLNLRKSYQLIAEERVAKKYSNCEVLNSYWVAEDGVSIWHEVILVDKSNPNVMRDPNYSWLLARQHKGRVHRGLTSAGKKMRNLQRKGKGAEKARPSRRANLRKL